MSVSVEKLAGLDFMSPVEKLGLIEYEEDQKSRAEDQGDGRFRLADSSAPLTPESPNGRRRFVVGTDGKLTRMPHRHTADQVREARARRGERFPGDLPAKYHNPALPGRILRTPTISYALNPDNYSFGDDYSPNVLAESVAWE